MSIANMVIYFGLAKHKHKKEQVFRNDFPYKVMIINLSQTIVVRS